MFHERTSFHLGSDYCVELFPSCFELVFLLKPFPGGHLLTEAFWRGFPLSFLHWNCGYCVFDKRSFSCFRLLYPLLPFKRILLGWFGFLNHSTIKGFIHLFEKVSLLLQLRYIANLSRLIDSKRMNISLRLECTVIVCWCYPCCWLRR